MNGHQHFHASDRIAAIKEFREFLQGTRDRKDVYEETDIPELEKQIQEALGSPEQIALMNFRLALLRSLRYAMAGSVTCRQIGALNNMRALYEGARINTPRAEKSE